MRRRAQHDYASFPVPTIGCGRSRVFRPRLPGRPRRERARRPTDTEIKIGQTMPYSGPASAWGVIGRAELAYFKMINDQGGVNGRKINLISLDDAYSPSNTVEQTRRLIEQERVAFIFGSLGGYTNLAVRQYLNDNKIPHLFLAVAADIVGDPEHYPWTIGAQSGNLERSPYLREIHSGDQAECENRRALSARRGLQDLRHRHARGPRRRKRIDDRRGSLLRTLGADGRFPNHQPARVRRGYADHRGESEGRGAGHPQGV